MELLKKFLKSKANLIFLGILLLSIFCRFYQLEKGAIFTYDQQVTVEAAKKILIDHRPVLLGMKTGVGEIFIAPFYFYLFSLPLIFSRMDPVGLAFFASLIGVLTTIAFYLVGKEIFSKKIGILAAFIHAGSFYLSSLARIAWNPNPLMLVILILIFALSKIYKKKEKYWLVLAIALGFSFSLHFSSLFLLPILVILFFTKKPIWPSKKMIFFSLAILLFFVSPLIVFDLRHQFVNSRAFWLFFTQGRGNFTFQPLAKIKIVLATLAEIIFAKRFFGDQFLILALLFFQPLFLLPFLLIVLGYSFFQGQTPGYYFLIIYPGAILAISYALVKIFAKYKMILLVLAVGFLIVNLSNFRSFGVGRDSLWAKKELVKFILDKQKGKPFHVSYTAMPGTTYGFDYLFDFYKQRPTGNLADPTYTIVVPYDFEGIKPELILNGIGLNLPKKQ